MCTVSVFGSRGRYGHDNTRVVDKKMKKGVTPPQGIIVESLGKTSVQENNTVQRQIKNINDSNTPLEILF